MTYAAADPSLTPAEVRQLCRENRFRSGGTPGYAPGFTQANVLIIPARYADDFRTFCQRNPVPCPLLGESPAGNPKVPKFLAKDSDIRTDCGLYRIYENGQYVCSKASIEEDWEEDSVAFYIGCSYSFEGALVDRGFELRHVSTSKVLPCYRSSVQLMPAGVFSGRMVLSMRPFRPEQLPDIIQTCRPYVKAHGEPVGWGVDGAKRLGVEDVNCERPEWGDSVEIREGEVPVYWACGVTPQQVVMDSKLPCKVISHSPGFMLVLDLKSEAVCML